jgi:thiamine kinase
MPDIRRLIEEIPGFGNAVVLERLVGGPASDSWLVEKDGERVVIRFDNPRAKKLGLDRESELKVLEQVASAGIGPDVIFASPAQGVLVTSFIQGGAWSRNDVYAAENLERLAATLRQLHALPVTEPKFAPVLAAKRYAEEVGTDQAARLAGQAAKLAAQLLAGDHTTALCHNDLVHRNIIGFHPVRLIDWEYAGVGDPLFDVAIVVQHHELSGELVQEFLKACTGHNAPEGMERLDAFCELYDLLCALWYMSVCSEQGPGSEYAVERGRLLDKLVHGRLIPLDIPSNIE